jgi:hypothetical protein
LSRLFVHLIERIESNRSQVDNLLNNDSNCAQQLERTIGLLLFFENQVREQSMMPLIIKLLYAGKNKRRATLGF